MRLIRNLLLVVLPFLSVSACSQSKSKNIMETKNVLVVYFSATGTTRNVAKQLADAAQADLCEIVPTEHYTSADLDWHDQHSRSSVEMNDEQARPAIEEIKVDISKYEIIFLGYPIWWNIAPRVVNTFIEMGDMTGKTVIPFATSGGSSITGSFSALKKAYPALKWKEGRLLNRASKEEIKSWLNKIGISPL